MLRIPVWDRDVAMFTVAVYCKRLCWLQETYLFDRVLLFDCFVIAFSAFRKVFLVFNSRAYKLANTKPW